MRRLLFALTLVVSSAAIPAGAAAQDAGSSDDRLRTAAERRRAWGETVVLGLLAGGIGTLVVVRGVREFVAALPRRPEEPVNLNDYAD